MGMLRLDYNLLFTVINILLLLLVVRLFLLKPIKKIMQKRADLVAQQFADADEANQKAQQLQTESEQALNAAQGDAAAMLVDAQQRAQEEYDRIIARANGDADRIREKAAADMAREREQAIRSLQQQMQGAVMDAAAKVVADNITEADTQQIYERFFAEAGDAK